MSGWQQKLLASLPEPVRADPKKAAALAGLAILFAGVMIKQFALGSGASPAAAAAATPSEPITLTASANAAGNSFAQPPRSTGDSPVGLWLAEPIKTLDRNLFEFKGEFYPRSSESVESTARVIEDELFWDQLAKSLSARADSKKQRQIRIDNLQQAAGKLKVQSTIMGPNPRAMVDGRMTRLGGMVEADAGGGSTVTFKVIKVEARRLVIERDGLKFEVPMGSGKARVLGEDE